MPPDDAPMTAAKKWPWWKKVLAYLALAGLAAASIALVDRKVHDPPPPSAPAVGLPIGAAD
jgi:hypothetical protein